MQSAAYYIRMESQAFGSRTGLWEPGRIQVWLIHAALLGVFGIYVPWMKGFGFLDPVLSTAYACMGVLFAAPVAAQAFSNDRPEAAKQALARILVAVIYGECIALGSLACGLATVSLTHGRRLLLPPLDTLGPAILMGVSASLALASAAAWFTLRFSASLARGAMRMIFLALLAAFVLRSQWLPEITWFGTLIALAVAALAIRALLRLYR